MAGASFHLVSLLDWFNDFFEEYLFPEFNVDIGIGIQFEILDELFGLKGRLVPFLKDFKGAVVIKVV